MRRRSDRSAPRVARAEPPCRANWAGLDQRMRRRSERNAPRVARSDPLCRDNWAGLEDAPSQRSQRSKSRQAASSSNMLKASNLPPGPPAVATDGDRRAPHSRPIKRATADIFPINATEITHYSSYFHPAIYPADPLVEGFGG